MCIDFGVARDIANLGLTLILAVATVLLAVYTYRLVEESRKARKSQLQPIVSLHIEQAETDPTLLFIIFRNIGLGIAYNLKFEIIKDLAYFETQATPIGQRGLFKEGMMFCPPGYSKKYFLMETRIEHERKLKEELVVNATFENAFEEKFKTPFHLKLSEQKMVSSISPADTYTGRIAESLDEIKKLLDKTIPNRT